MLKIADFYKCYRAFVRGKVESIQMGTTSSLEQHAKNAARYFRLALRYAIAGSEPLALVVTGRVSTGKTSVARQIGRELDWPVISSDQIRKSLAGVPLTERTASELRDKVYSEPMTDQTYGELLKQGLEGMEKSGGVILDATFSSRKQRDLLRDRCAKSRVRLQFVELDVDLATVERRLKARDHTSAEISDARFQDLEKLNAAYEPPAELASDLIKISATNSVSDTGKTLLLQLTEKQLR
jgi:predicted kinase